MTNITEQDFANAKAFVIETAVKAHVKQGMTEDAARERVQKALDAPWNFPELPTWEELDAMPIHRLIAAGRAADDDPGENLSHLTPEEMLAKLCS